ncbi:MAG: methylated-DNA--[protein]-cysteine S-methyltransferase [Chitinophagaceae bacterium]
MEKIYTSFYACPLGNLRISSSNNCITEVHFMERDEDNGMNILSSENLPAVLEQCIEELNEYFHGDRKHFDVPVCQQGTPFQHSVWNELMNIPFGKTISYLTLAKRLGDPKAIRAAASTNGKNSIAIIVPCHRVIGSNNDLVGYAGGLWRKKWLLDLETKVTYGVQTLF